MLVAKEHDFLWSDHVMKLSDSLTGIVQQDSAWLAHL